MGIYGYIRVKNDRKFEKNGWKKKIGRKKKKRS